MAILKSEKNTVNRMSITTRYRALNKLQVGFTDQLIGFLRQESKETGNTMNSIVRKAVNEYQMKRINEKLRNHEKITHNNAKFFKTVKYEVE